MQIFHVNDPVFQIIKYMVLNPYSIFKIKIIWREL